MLETNFCVCLTVAHISKRLSKRYRTPVTYLRSYAMTQKMLLNMYLFTTTNNQQPTTNSQKPSPINSNHTRQLYLLKIATLNFSEATCGAEYTLIFDFR